MKKVNYCFLVVLVVLLAWQGAVAKETSTAQGWFQKGVAYEKQGVYGEAIKMYTRAIELQRDYAEAYFKRGKAYRVQSPSESNEALEDFTVTIKLAPTNGEAYYERGLLYAYLLYNENAVADMRTAASLGHEGARLWLLSPEEREAEEAKEDSRYIYLGNYMPSGNEPMVHFDFNKANIKNQYYALLDEVAMVVKDTLPEVNIIVAGYADSIGTKKYNHKLSMNRARAIESYLEVKHGIQPDRVILKAFGENGPIATNETEEGRAKNRRVELLGMKK